MYSIETGITTSLPFTFLRDKSVQETEVLLQRYFSISLLKRISLVNIISNRKWKVEIGK